LLNRSRARALANSSWKKRGEAKKTQGGPEKKYGKTVLRHPGIEKKRGKKTRGSAVGMEKKDF